MTLYVDAGWVLNVQVAVSPVNTPVRDWGALHCMSERHRYERFAGEPYYEEVAARAATFLHTALILEPFSDFNAVIGAACAQMYLAVGRADHTPTGRDGQAGPRHAQGQAPVERDRPATA